MGQCIIYNVGVTCVFNWHEIYALL